MTPEEFGPFKTLLHSLGEVYNEPISADRALLYFGALGDYPIEAVRSATLAVIKRAKFFPKPAELIELIEGEPGALAYIAWERVRHATDHVGPDSPITFNDPALHAAIEAMGGWREATLWTHLPVDEFGYRGVEFRKLYLHYRLHPQPDTPQMLNQLGLGNPVRVIDTRGLPGAPPQLALPAPTPVALMPAEELSERCRDFVEDLARNQRLPEPIRRERPRLAPDEPEELTEARVAARTARKVQQLERFQRQLGDAQ